MQEDHAAAIEKIAAPDPAELMVDSVPVVIAIDQDAIELPVEPRENVQTVRLVNRDILVAGVLGHQILIEAGVDDRVGNIPQRQDAIRGEPAARADLAKGFPSMGPGKRDDEAPREFDHGPSSRK